MRGQVGCPHSSTQAAPHLRGPRAPRGLDPGLAGIASSPGSGLAQSPMTNRAICCPLPVPNQSGRSESEAGDNVTTRVTLWDAAKASAPFPKSLHCPPVSMATPDRSCRADGPQPSVTELQQTHELIGSWWGLGSHRGPRGSKPFGPRPGPGAPLVCPLLPVHSPCCEHPACETLSL